MELQVGALKCVINSVKLQINHKTNGKTAELWIHMEASDLQVDMQDCVPFPFPCRWLGEEGGEGVEAGPGAAEDEGRRGTPSVAPSNHHPHLSTAISHF